MSGRPAVDDRTIDDLASAMFDADTNHLTPERAAEAWAHEADSYRHDAQAALNHLLSTGWTPPGFIEVIGLDGSRALIPRAEHQPAPDQPQG